MQGLTLDSTVSTRLCQGQNICCPAAMLGVVDSDPAPGDCNRLRQATYTCDVEPSKTV